MQRDFTRQLSLSGIGVRLPLPLLTLEFQSPPMIIYRIAQCHNLCKGVEIRPIIIFIRTTDSSASNLYYE